LGGFDETGLNDAKGRRAKMSEANYWKVIEGGFFDKPQEISGYPPEICQECKQYKGKKEEPKLKVNLFTTFAKEAAADAWDANLTNNQLRNFYDTVKSTHDKLLQQPTPKSREGMFEVEKQRLKLLFSKVAYAQKQKGSGRKIPEVFARFMNTCLELTTSKDATYEDFEAFVLTFEAFAGYFGTEKKKGESNE
jgi:CRISPR type III-A-associated protein Csm2